MSCLTATWHESRTPCFASLGLMCVFSVGRMSPPPSRILTLHCAHVPPPPQALETKIPLSAKAPSSFPPAGTSSVFCSLTSIFTLPAATSCLRASRIIATRASTIAVKNPTPSSTT